MEETTFKYPHTEAKPDVIEEHKTTNGTVKIHDPYRWLEDPSSEETKEWIDRQASFAENYLSSKCVYRQKFNERLTDLFNYPKFSCPRKEGKNYFFFKNNGLQNQSVIYIQETIDSEEKVFLDPNTLSEDGTVSISSYSFSEDGEFFAYGLSEKGSDWKTIYVKTVNPQHPLAEKLKDEKIEWVKFSSISWTHDHKGFFYGKYPTQKNVSDKGTETEKLKDFRIYYHKLGTSQEEDVLIYYEPDNLELRYSANVSDDGKFLCITVYKDCNPENKFYYYNISENWNPQKGDPLIQVNKVIDSFDAGCYYLTNEGNTFYFYTNDNAPKYKVISFDVTDNLKNAKVIIPEKDDVLTLTECTNKNFIVACYTRDVVDVLELYTLFGSKIKDLEMPLGTVIDISCDKKDSEVFYKFSSFLTPGRIYRYSFSTDSTTVYRDTDIKGFDASKFQTEQIFYESKDGTKVPMFIVSNKDFKKDGNNPVYLYGYGGFNINIQPTFGTSRLIWMQHFGGICVIANIRGGGEYGDNWHKSGTKERKQNTFDDFQASAEYLIKNNYTKPSLIAINGGSNGGLLVAACINQRPELFGAAVIDVGVLDMLRFHKMTAGSFWTSDYGNPDTPEDFEYIIKYSPYHNVKKGKPYPSVMLTTGDHDDRVSPLHSFKFIAELQEKLGKEEYQKKPLIIRIEKKGGHGAGKPTTMVLAETADKFAFIANELGLVWKD